MSGTVIEFRPRRPDDDRHLLLLRIVALAEDCRAYIDGDGKAWSRNPLRTNEEVLDYVATTTSLTAAVMGAWTACNYTGEGATGTPVHVGPAMPEALRLLCQRAEGIRRRLEAMTAASQS